MFEKPHINFTVPYRPPPNDHSGNIVGHSWKFRETDAEK